MTVSDAITVNTKIRFDRSGNISHVRLHSNRRTHQRRLPRPYGPGPEGPGFVLRYGLLQETYFRLGLGESLLSQMIE